MSTAIVTGATGILGSAIVNELSKHPEEWQSIYAMSRSKKGSFPPRVKHSHLDLTGSASDMAAEIKHIEADYVFFAAYLDAGNADENDRVNGEMFENFLKALKANGMTDRIKRIILVCGLKQYGVHLGTPKQPMEETDPWLPQPPANFYYRQQRSLHSFAATHGIEWVVTYSNEVIGYAKGNFMNLATTLGIYAAIHAELGSELPFPGSQAVYTRFDCFTSAKLHAEFCNWAAFAPKAANQAFNTVNGDIESWQNLWPKIAAHFGLKVPSDQFSRPAQLPSDLPMGDWSPLSLRAAELGLEGLTPPDRLKQRTDLIKWSELPDVKEAWKRVSERHGLDSDGLEKATWGFAAFVLGREYDLVVNMTKAREAGFNGFVDSWKCLEAVFEELEENRLLPPKRV